MYLIRRAKLTDTPTLHKLAKMVHFINLPPDKDIIQAKIVHSRNTFLKAAGGVEGYEQEDVPDSVIKSVKSDKSLGGLGATTHEADLFMFVLEDTESGQPLGSSQVLAKMGGPGSPNVSFKLSQKHFFSQSLQTGTSHMVAELYLDESGPTEIGGLILQPSYRGHKKKLGLFLSMIRFHMIGLHRTLFADRVLAEMMAPITPEGDSLLWDYLGRRFVPLSYDEADRFCQYSREFITSLLPKDPIYLSLLPPNARAAVAQVHNETKSARKMLERLGFEYRNFVDPFDGGPHLDAKTDEILPVAHTNTRTVGNAVAASKCTEMCIVSKLDTDGEFRAIHEKVSLVNGNAISLTKECMDVLEVEKGDEVGVTPMDFFGKPAGKDAKSTKKSAKKKTSKAGSKR
ncbi:MAG: arginine N-succinyltransferase [Phycisphaerales bacterium JB061]